MKNVLFQESVDVGKGWAKIGATASCQGKIMKEFSNVCFFPDDRIGMDLIITLNNMYLTFVKKAVSLTDNLKGFFQKLFHQWTVCGIAGIDYDGEF